MRKPRILNSLPFTRRKTSSALGGAGARGGAILTFSMEPQKQTNWCWAATSKSVDDYFLGSSTWTQCRIVNTTLSETSCCGPAGGDLACNQPWYLDRALKTVNAYRGMIGTDADIPTVKSEISKDCPLGVRIGWRGGGGHFVIVYGWSVTSDGTIMLSVDDPIHRSTTLPEAKFRTKYRSNGRWTHSYFVTNPSASGGAIQSADLRAFTLEEMAREGILEFPEALGG